MHLISRRHPPHPNPNPTNHNFLHLYQFLTASVLQGENVYTLYSVERQKNAFHFKMSSMLLSFIERKLYNEAFQIMFLMDIHL